MSNKGTIEIFGNVIPLTLPKKYLKHHSFGYLTIGGIGSIMRQVLNYLKSNGEIYFDKLWIRTQSYSGGSSINVYTIGTDENSEKIIKSIVSLFEMGNFNPMEDLYELKNIRLQASFENGDVSCSSKYNFYYSHPPYDVEHKYLEEI